MRRPILALAAIGIVAGLLAAEVIAPRATGTVSYSGRELYGRGLVNGARVIRGIGALRADPDLTRCARAHSRDLATNGNLRHSGCAQAAGARHENVGSGPSQAAVFRAMWRSSAHRRALLCRCGRIGVAVERDDGGTYWVTQLFR